MRWITQPKYPQEITYSEGQNYSQQKREIGHMDKFHLKSP